MLLMLQFGAEGQDDLAKQTLVTVAWGFLWHSACCREPVSPSTGQHLVDTDDMERVEPHSDMKAILATTLYHVFVGTNTGSLQCFRRELLIFI